MNLEVLLDFDRPFDIDILDAAVKAFYEGDPSMRNHAQIVLTKFQNHPDSWQLVAHILRQSQSIHSKVIGLRILERFVVVRWNTLPIENKIEIRNFIVGLVVEISSDPELASKQKMYLNKLDSVLVEILKKEWPHHWPTFTSEIVAASRTNTSLCENNMKILKLLSEDIFDYGEDQITQARMRKLKGQMMVEFKSIFDLCREILSTSSKNSLVTATLETTLKFLSWMPVDTVYDGSMLESLERWLSGDDVQRNLSLQCCTELVSLEITEEHYGTLLRIFDIVLSAVYRIFTPDTDISALYESASTEDQSFVQNLALFLTAFLERHVSLLEDKHGISGVTEAYKYLITISRVPERELWKICLEYWDKYIRHINHEHQPSGQIYQRSPHHEIIKELRRIMIDKMVAPDDVLIIQHDDGESTRQFIRQGDSTSIYKSMRQMLCQLTILDVDDTQRVIRERFQGHTVERKMYLVHINSSQGDGAEGSWSWEDLNKLCWAVGSISGTMNEASENQFMEGFIQDLIKMINESHTNDERCAIDSCLMYIGSQYPRFLKAHDNLLSAILQKIATYLHDKNTDVQEMAVSSFYKLCQGCAEELINIEKSPITEVRDYTSDLSPSQICVVYGAIGFLVAVASPAKKERYVDMVMSIPNDMQCKLLQQSNDIEQGQRLDVLKCFVNVIRINIHFCSTVGRPYQYQFRTIYPNILSVYKATSAQLRGYQGPESTQRLLHRLKASILSLVDTFVTKCYVPDETLQTILLDALEAILADHRDLLYSPAGPDQCSAMAFHLLSSVLHATNAKSAVNGKIESMVNMGMLPTLPWISQDFVQYPECRVGFYTFLRDLTKQAFSSLLNLPEETFKVIMDCISWGAKHPLREVSDLALESCLCMINQISEHPDEDVASSFYKMYYLAILHDILAILTDPDRESGFDYQSQVLARLLELAQEGEIYTPLFDSNEVDNYNMSNVEFLQGHVEQLLCNAFPLLQKNQIMVLVLGMFEYSGDLHRFQHDLRDFLVDIRQVGEDSGDIRAEEQEAELELLRYL